MKNEPNENAIQLRQILQNQINHNNMWANLNPPRGYNIISNLVSKETTRIRQLVFSKSKSEKSKVKKFKSLYNKNKNKAWFKSKFTDSVTFEFAKLSKDKDYKLNVVLFKNEKIGTA